MAKKSGNKRELGIEALCAKLQEAKEEDVSDRPGEEWFTTREYSEKAGVSLLTAQRRLYDALRKGIVERVQGSFGPRSHGYYYRTLE